MTGDAKCMLPNLSPANLQQFMGKNQHMALADKIYISD